MCNIFSTLSSFVKNYFINQKLKKVEYDTVKPFSLDGKTVNAKIVDIYDGDTCTAAIVLKDDIFLFKIRLAHIDTPEMKDKNNSDKSKHAKLKLLELVLNKPINTNRDYSSKDIKEICGASTNLIKIKCGKFDKYGRCLGELYSNYESKSFNQILLDHGFAKPYEGKKKEAF